MVSTGTSVARLLARIGGAWRRWTPAVSGVVTITAFVTMMVVLATAGPSRAGTSITSDSLTRTNVAAVAAPGFYGGPDISAEVSQYHAQQAQAARAMAQLLAVKHAFHLHHLAHMARLRAAAALLSEVTRQHHSSSVQQLVPSGGSVVPTSAFQACVIRAESGGDAQVMNSSGHYGLYQFSYSTWTLHGGDPALFGHASAAYQTQIFWNTYRADGTSDWAPYDGC